MGLRGFSVRQGSLKLPFALSPFYPLGVQGTCPRSFHFSLAVPLRKTDFMNENSEGDRDDFRVLEEIEVDDLYRTDLKRHRVPPASLYG